MDTTENAVQLDAQGSEFFENAETDETSDIDVMNVIEIDEFTTMVLNLLFFMYIHIFILTK